MSNNTVTVGILSDSHGYLHPGIRDAVNQCDYIVHAGDIFNANVLEQLEPKKELIAVAGNNDFPDFWDSSEADIVNALPKNHNLTLPGGVLAVEHGHRLGNMPNHTDLRWDHADARLIVYGHTHKRVIDQKEVPWVVNPGASGKVRNHGGSSCLILRASEKKWEIETILFEDS